MIAELPAEPCRELKVLILEDSPTDAELMQRALSRGGLRFDALRVDTEQDFTEALESFAPDVALLDHKLPTYTGPEALACIRRLHPEIPAVMVSGSIGDEAAIELLKAGASDYVLKGNLARLAAAVQHAIANARDAKARRLAEQALAESENRLSTIMDVMGDGVLVGDAESRRFVLCNPAICSMLGYSEDELLHLGIADIHPAEALGEVIAQYEQPPPPRLEDLPMKRKDGSIVYASLTGSEVVLGGRRLRVGVFRDVTERRRAEQSLRESEERFRRLVEQNVAGVAIVYDDGELAYSNPYFASLAGYQPAEIIGRSLFELIPEADQQAVAERVREQTSGQGGFVQLASAMRAKDGRIVDIIVNASPMVYEGRPASIAVVIDNTARKAAEDALRTSEAQLSNALQIARAGHWSYDVARDRFIFNDNFYRIFRTTVQEVGSYELSPAEYARRFVHPEDASVVAKEVAGALATSDPNYSREIEHRIIYADGEVGYLAVRFFIEKDKSGRTFRTYGVNQDITERKRAEERIREQEAKFRALIEQNVAGVAIIRGDATVAYVNPYFASVTGHKIDEVIGHSIFDFVADQEKTAIAAQVQAQFSGRAPLIQLETTLRHRSGARVDILANASLASYEGSAASFIIAIDITERRRAQEALEKSHALLERAEHIAHIAAWEWDVVHDRLTVSDELYRIFGRDPKEFEPTMVAFLGLLHPDDRQRAEAAVKAAIEERKPLDVELRTVRPDGQERAVRVRADLTFNDAGEAVLMTGSTLDITESKAAEGALVRLNRSLRTLSSGNEVLVRVTTEEDLYREICRVIVEDGGYRAAWIGAPVTEGNDKIIKALAAAGVGSELFQRPGLVGWGDDPLGRGVFGNVVRTGEPQVVQDFVNAPEMAPWRQPAAELGVAAVAAFPLTDETGVLAVLGIYASEPDAFNADEIKLLQELANDLNFGVRAARERVARTDIEQRWRASLEATVGAIARAVEMRDPYTAGHQHRVATLAMAIGRELGLPEQDVRGLYLAGIIHDVGKITVPSEILNKPGKLTKVEFELIKAHAQSGYDIVKGVDFPWPIGPIMLQHHERLDGSGYPQGLAGDAIERGARILAVADVVEAMMSHRPYRPALGLDAALTEVGSKKGLLFEPDAVEACVKLFREKGFDFTDQGPPQR